MGRVLKLRFSILMLVLQCGPSQHTQDLIAAINKMDAYSATSAVLQGADVHARVGDAQDPLILVAASNGSRLIVRLLIRSGADVNATNRHGYTPLIVATRGPSEKALDVVKDLVENGADINFRTPGGITALAAAIGGQPEVVAYLLEHGAMITFPDSPNRNPLLYAVLRNDIEGAHLLLKHGADPTATDLDKISPLNTAERHKNHPMINLLKSYRPAKEN